MERALTADEALELIREELHAPEPDFGGVEAVLASGLKGEGALVVQDYLLGALRSRLRSPSGGVWGLLRVAAERFAEHPEALKPAEVLGAWLASEERAVEGLECLGVFARRGELGGVAFCGALALALVVGERAWTDAQVGIGARGAALALCGAASDRGEGERRGQRVCAAVRGAQSWGALEAVDALIREARFEGHDDRGPVVAAQWRQRAQRVFDRLWDLLHEGGRPYLFNLARRDVIGVRRVRYAELPVFAQVATGAALVAELSSEASWSAQARGQAEHRFWSEATWALGQAGLVVPLLASPSGDEGDFDETDAVLVGIDGEHALEIALSAAASLGAVGGERSASALARALRPHLSQRQPGYEAWCAAIERGAW